MLETIFDCEPKELMMRTLITKTAKHVIPWRVMCFLKKHWLGAYHFLLFGKLNVNDASHWNDAWKRHGQEGFRATAELSSVRRMVVSQVPVGVSVLDVGCGVGELLDILAAERQSRCHGIDISSFAVEQITSRGHDGRVAELPAIPYPDDAFDVVICTETLEHVTGVRQAVAEFRRVLRPGGLLVLTVPDGDVDDEDAHVSRFTLRSLRSLLEREFEVRQLEVMNDSSCQVLFAVAAAPGNAVGSSAATESARQLA